MELKSTEAQTVAEAIERDLGLDIGDAEVIVEGDETRISWALEGGWTLEVNCYQGAESFFANYAMGEIRARVEVYRETIIPIAYLHLAIEAIRIKRAGLTGAGRFADGEYEAILRYVKGRRTVSALRAALYLDTSTGAVESVVWGLQAFKLREHRWDGRLRYAIYERLTE